MSFKTVDIQASPDISEILQVELADIGYEAFLENDHGFETSIPADQYQVQALSDVLTKYGLTVEGAAKVEEVEKQNWNKLWESNFHPIEVDGKCYVRAHFHEPKPEYNYELVITPKMSFGTGHHATTTQMIRQQLNIDHTGKRVFDIGCGTGILGIMAAKLGATEIDACDIEDWSVENTLENAAVNQVSILAYHGTAKDRPPQDYDIILANINRNILLAELPIYSKLLAPTGHLLMSGFHAEDLPLINQQAEDVGLKLQTQSQEGEWCCVVYRPQKP